MMVVMMFTPLGTISFLFISITIAHIPVLIATIMFGLKSGLVLSLLFGGMSMWIAITAPVGILDPLFQNPLISILPRLLIPVATHYTYVGLTSLNEKVSETNKIVKGMSNPTGRAIISVVVGNLANTFFVYLCIYLFVKERFEQLSGQSALSLIISLISSATLIQTLIIVFISVPVITRIKVKR